MAQFAESLGFDLTDAFAGDAELAADFLEGAAGAVDQAESLLEDGTLTLVKAVEHVLELVAQQVSRGHLHRTDGGVGLDEIAELGVALAVTHLGLERNGLL